MNSERIQQTNAWKTPNIDLASFAALVLQICEFVNSFFDEAEYLCRSRFTLVKFLYIWSRYITLAGQIVSLALSQTINEGPMQIHLCVGTFVYRVILAQLTLSCLEIILLIRVYALYNRSRRIKYFLCAAYFTNCAIYTWSSSQIIRALIKGKSCIPEVVPLLAVAATCASASCFQMLIICMTAFKYIVGHHSGRGRTPLTSLILREGIAVIFILFGILTVDLTYESIHRFASVFGEVAFSWYISLLSVMGCRLILDMRRLAVSHPTPGSDGDGEIELTSNLDMTIT